MHPGLVQTGGHPGVDDLGIIAHSGVELAQGGVLVGGQAALLLQLPLGGFKGVLPFFQLAGGQLPQLLLHSVAELAHHADGAVLKVGHDAGPAVVVDHLAGGGLSIFQKGGILGQGDHPALEQHLTCERLFKMCSVHRICVLSR